MIQIEVAVPTPLARTFTYLAPGPVPVGSRVLVPFGRQRLVGVALGTRPETAQEGGEDFVLKPIEAVIDAEPVYSATVLEIARWISTYYMHPLGEVLRTMLPASASKVIKEVCTLSAKGEEERRAAATPLGRQLRALFGAKKSELLAATVRSKVRRLAAAADPELGLVELKALKRAGLLAFSKGSKVKARKQDTGADPVAGRGADPGTDPADIAHLPSSTPAAAAAPGVKPEPRASAGQQQVIDTVLRDGLSATESKVFLLHGVTGSGKTEVYLKLIAAVLAEPDAGGQALLLVPEISLTPQMTHVFTGRFPGLVAVVHSAMSDTDRWAELSRIRRGEAKILIGPRSAVFGPFQRLRLLLVDEEHDHSYKQGTGLTYHGRDVAVLRGRLEHAVVVLGSATPSLESYQNALSGRYTLLNMPERITGRPLPELELIATERSPRQGHLVHTPGASRLCLPTSEEDAELPIDPRIVQALRDNLAAGRQAIVLVNRRGYAYYLFSLAEKKAVQCPHCSISMTLHARSTVLRCHYCDHSTTVAKIVAERPEDRLLAVGYGSQKAEDGLKALLPGARVVRLDSDAVADSDLLPRTLAEFRAGAIDVLVGTQMLAKGHDFPNVTLIVILEVDQLLGLPDFRAGERTFQLIVQAAGRAGRAEHVGKVLLQTLRSEHPVIAAATKQDYASFVASELEFRRLHAYPPFARMIAVEFNSPDKAQLNDLCQQIEAWMERAAQLQPDRVRHVRLLGPSVPAIETIRGRHRRQLIFASSHVEALRALALQFARDFQRLPHAVRMRIDVDPQSLI